MCIAMTILEEWVFEEIDKQDNKKKIETIIGSSPGGLN
jgi:hypothetical protein